MTDRLIVKVSVFVYTCGPVNFCAGYTRLVRNDKNPCSVDSGRSGVYLSSLIAYFLFTETDIPVAKYFLLQICL